MKVGRKRMRTEKKSRRESFPLVLECDDDGSGFPWERSSLANTK